MSFYVSSATFFLLHCDEWDRVVALPRHKFVTGATLLQLGNNGILLVMVATVKLSKLLLYLACKSKACFLRKTGIQVNIDETET